ncbi:MAG: hypothetical protein FWD23_18350, partial [Oscillospiraceae bacterium]|nr:hypothetical protein [Oscillospiraceae bacterium]
KIMITEERSNMNMNYSKNTDELIREFNDFIVKAKDTAKLARKIKAPEHMEFWTKFWNAAADVTDELADDLKNTLGQISAVGERPDEITTLFNVMKAIDDMIFKTYTLLRSIEVTIARGTPETPEYLESQKILCGKYHELLVASSDKALKMAGIYEELSKLIFNDMLKTAEEKLRDFITQTKTVAEKITGHSYLKDEITNITNKLESTPFKKIPMHHIGDIMFTIEILSFAIRMDIRCLDENRTLPDDFKTLKKNIEDLFDFFKTLEKVVKSHFGEKSDSVKYLQTIDDIAFYSNILLFYAKGELEKMSKAVGEEQIIAFDAIVNKMSDCFVFMADITETNCEKAAGMYYETTMEMEREANKLGELKGPMLYITNEFKGLADKLKELSENFAAQKPFNPR